MLYDSLGQLETLGVCRRGYFVEGLGGAQFALPGAVERLRATRDDGGDGTAVVLAATDPRSRTARRCRGRSAARTSASGRRAPRAPTSCSSTPSPSSTSSAAARACRRSSRRRRRASGRLRGARRLRPRRPHQEARPREGRRRERRRLRPRAAARRARLPRLAAPPDADRLVCAAVTPTHSTLRDVLLARARTDPERLAFDDGRRSVTYAELLRRASVTGGPARRGRRGAGRPRGAGDVRRRGVHRGVLGGAAAGRRDLLAQPVRAAGDAASAAPRA